MLNLNGSLTKAGVAYSTLWSEDFADDYFKTRLREWLTTGRTSHDTSHVVPYDKCKFDADERRARPASSPTTLQRDKAIMGVFDEGCMGMFNAIIPDHLLNPTGVFKERLSQSALYYETTQVSDDEARAVRKWIEDRGMKFHTGPKHETDLTDAQILQQCKMYIAALRIADDFGCDLIGIQYQQGLKDLLPASDLVEGTLNNSDRPPVRSRDGKRVLYEGEPLPTSTKSTNAPASTPGSPTASSRPWASRSKTRCTTSAGATPTAPARRRTTSGSSRSAAPPRRPTSTAAGPAPRASASRRCTSPTAAARSTASPSRARSSGRASTSRTTRWRWTSAAAPPSRCRARKPSAAGSRPRPQWPIMHAVTYGVSRDQMMAQHKANHVQVVYANDAAAADRTLEVKAAMGRALGLQVNCCGTRTPARG